MEVSEVRRRLRAAIDEAKRRSTERRTQRDAAARAWGELLPQTAVPAFQAVASALTGEGHRFKVHTPGEAVRLSPDRPGEEFIELSLDTSGDEPAVMLRSAHGRGRRMVSAERSLATGAAISGLTQEQIVDALLQELIPFIER